MVAYPLLKELPRDLDSLDLLLPSQAVTDLVRHGAHALTEAGITVLLPRAWKVLEPSLRVRVGAPDVSVRSSDSEVGMAQLLDFDVRLALGDNELWPDEVADLVRQQGGLVRLR
ncbi:MAG: SNF2 helicase-associated domain-containing protein, partial [Leifsonia sp.]